MPHSEVILKITDPVTVASAREVVETPDQMRERCAALLDRVCGALSLWNLRALGTALALYHSGDEDGIDVEMTMVLSQGTTGRSEAGLFIRPLPPVQVAGVVYQGSHDDFGPVGQVHADIAAWVAASGYGSLGRAGSCTGRPRGAQTATA